MAVKRSTSKSSSRIASGIHEIATKAKDKTPVKPEQKSQIEKFTQARKELDPYITREPRGDDEVEIVNVTEAVSKGASYTALKDIGVSRSKIDKALREQTAEDEVEESPVSLGPDIPTPTKSGLTSKPQAGVPTPIARQVPKPGEKLTVDKEIRDTAREYSRASGTLLAGSEFPGGPSADVLLAYKAGALNETVKDVEKGNLTNAEAKDRVNMILDQPISGPLSDAKYVVPGVGTFLHYQDARDAGWNIVETGMFVTSAALDAVMFFTPLKAGGGKVIKLPKSIIKHSQFTPLGWVSPKLAQAAPATKLSRGTLLRHQREIKAAVEAPTKPAPAPTKTPSVPKRADPVKKPRTTPRPEKPDPDAPTPRRKTDDPTPTKPGPLDDPMVIPRPQTIPEQPPGEEPAREFEFAPDTGFEVTTITRPDTGTEVRPETFSEFETIREREFDTPDTSTQINTGFPDVDPYNVPTVTPYTNPFTDPDTTTKTETPTKPRTETPTKPRTETPTKPRTETPTKPETETPTKPRTETPTKPRTETPTKPRTETPIRPPLKTPTRPPPLGPVKAPTKPPVPGFELPKGKRLAPGRFPREVTWPQGTVQITYNLSTGVTQYAKRTPDRTKPRDGFQVTRTAKTPPKPQILDMGITDVLINSDSIRFRKSKTSRPGPQFRGRRGRP
jgi:hypothetical protein